MAGPLNRQEIVRITDLVSMVGEYVPLIWIGECFCSDCPFHDDWDHSLIVNGQFQRFRCTVCGIEGDVADWVMQYERITLDEALVMLCERAAYGHVFQPIGIHSPSVN